MSVNIVDVKRAQNIGFEHHQKKKTSQIFFLLLKFIVSTLGMLLARIKQPADVIGRAILEVSMQNSFILFLNKKYCLRR